MSDVTQPAGSTPVTATPGSSDAGGPATPVPPVVSPGEGTALTPTNSTEQQQVQQQLTPEQILEYLGQLDAKGLDIFKLPGAVGEKLKSFQRTKDMEVAEAQRAARLAEQRAAQLEQQMRELARRQEESYWDNLERQARTPAELAQIREQRLQAERARMEQELVRERNEIELRRHYDIYINEFGVPPHVLAQFDRMARAQVGNDPGRVYYIVDGMVKDGLRRILAQMAAERQAQSQPQPPAHQPAPAVPVVHPAGSHPAETDLWALFKSGQFDKLDEILNQRH